MMFNWNQQHQVGGTLWPELSESEDHIVPCPRETEENTLFIAGDYRKDERNAGFNTDVRSTEQYSQAKSDLPSCKSESSSSFHTNEELSSSRLDVDTWLDFPNFIALSDQYTEGNDHNSVTTELMDDLTDATNMNSMKGDSMLLDREADLFGHEDKESDDFLDCDWATFGDFDDLGKIFRNDDSIFGHDMIGDADGFLSPSNDVIDSTAQAIPMPNLPFCKDQTFDEGFSSIQTDDHADKKRSPSPKEKDQTFDEGFSSIHIDDHADKKRSPLQKEKKMIPRSQNKAEERRKNRPSRNLNDAAGFHNYNQNQHAPRPKMHSSVTTPLQTFQSEAISQQMQFGDAKPMEHLSSSNQVTFNEHGYPTYCFSGIPLPPYVQVDRNQKRPVPASYEFCPDHSKHPKISNKLPDAKPTSMTPQEKMKKLRRLQQMQAQLAIQQQQQQYSHQITGANDIVSQSCSQKDETKDAMTSTIGIQECAHMVPSTELNMLAEQDESQMISTLIDCPSVEETMYHQLLDAVGKLDIRIRLCIRDSLFRLARSAMERQSASDQSSTNKSNRDEDEVSADEEFKNHKRSITLADAETDTNPIDRIVANLLFQRPTKACPSLDTDKLPRST